MPVQWLIKGSPRAPAIGVLLTGCLALVCGAPASAQCHPPHFQTGQDYDASVFVSIQPDDLSLDGLTCLARTLRNRRQQHRRFFVSFFDSLEAARYFQGMPVEGGYPPRWHEWAKALRAMYSFDLEKREESIEVLPMGFNTAPSLLTTIDLQLGRAPHCRLEIQNRCLLAAMEKITYPQGAVKTGASAVIVLTGSIAPDGRVMRLVVAQADVKPAAERSQLVNAALEDLKAWRFDAGPHDDAIRITYSFAVDTSLPRGVEPRVRWVSPDQVTVRASPPE
jgi:hypothetical protein